MTGTVFTNETWSLSVALLELAECGEKDLVADILNIFTADTQAKIETLPELLADSDFNGIGRVAHSLKGSARQIGLEDLANVAEKLERAAASENRDLVTQMTTILAQHWPETRRAVNALRDGL